MWTGRTTTDLCIFIRGNKGSVKWNFGCDSYHMYVESCCLSSSFALHYSPVLVNDKQGRCCDLRPVQAKRKDQESVFGSWNQSCEVVVDACKYRTGLSEWRLSWLHLDTFMTIFWPFKEYCSPKRATRACTYSNSFPKQIFLSHQQSM